MTQTDNFSRFADTGAVRDSLRQRSVRGVISMLGGSGIDFVLRLLSTFVLARLLSPTDFGLIAMVLSVTAIAEQFSELGLSTATIQCRELTHAQVTNLFWINLAIGVALSLLICALAPAIAHLFNNASLFPIALVVSTTFFWGGLTVQHQALLSRQLKQTHLACVRLAASFLSLVVAVVLAINHLGVWALAWREVSRAFFVAVGMWIACRWIPGWPKRKANIGGLLRYGSHLTLNGLADAIRSQLDRYLIGGFFGATALGLYRQAQQLLLAPIDQLHGPIFSVASPGLSMLQADHERYRRYYQRIALVISLSTMPLGLFVAICAGEITHVVLGPRWIAATIYIQIFGAVAFLKPVLDSVGVVLLTYGLSKRLLVLSVIYNTISTLLLIAGVPWGAVGLALSSVIAPFVLLFPKLYFSFRGTPVTMRCFFRAVSSPAFASIAMAAALLLAQGYLQQFGMTVSLFASAVLGSFVYAAVLLVLPHGRREIIGLGSALWSSFQRKRTVPVIIDQPDQIGVA